MRNEERKEETNALGLSIQWRWKNIIHPTLHDKLMLFSHLVGLELGEADGEVDGFPLIDGVPLGCDDMEG